MCLAFSPYGPEGFTGGTMRVGEAVVHSVDRQEGVIYVDCNLTAAVAAACAQDFIYCPDDVAAFKRATCPCAGKPLARWSCGLCGRPAAPPVAGIGTTTTYIAGRNYGKTAATLRWTEQMRDEGRVDLDAGCHAPAELGRLVVGRMAEGGPYRAPEPLWDLSLHVAEAMLAIETMGSAPDHDPGHAAARANLRRYFEACLALMRTDPSDSFFAVNRSADAAAKFSPSSLSPTAWLDDGVWKINPDDAPTILNDDRIHLLYVGRWVIDTGGATPALLAPVVSETCGGCGRSVRAGEYCPCDGEAAADDAAPADPYAEHAHAQLLKAREAAAQTHHPKMHASRLESIEQETEVARRDLARLRNEAALRTAAADELERVIAEFGRPGKAGA